MDLLKAYDHSRGPFVIKEFIGTGVPPPDFTAFTQLVEFADLSILASRTDTAAGVHFLTCALIPRISHRPNIFAHLVFHIKPNK